MLYLKYRRMYMGKQLEQALVFYVLQCLTGKVDKDRERR